MVGVQDVRDINQTVFLHLIRERQPISRADIAKYTGLRPGTVSAIVNRLIKNNLVYEGTEGPSSGGRRPKYLFINSESFYVLAIDIDLDRLSEGPNYKYSYYYEFGNRVRNPSVPHLVR